MVLFHLFHDVLGSRPPLVRLNKFSPSICSGKYCPLYCQPFTMRIHKETSDRSELKSRETNRTFSRSRADDAYKILTSRPVCSPSCSYLFGGLVLSLSVFAEMVRVLLFNPDRKRLDGPAALIHR